MTRNALHLALCAPLLLAFGCVNEMGDGSLREGGTAENEDYGTDETQGGTETGETYGGGEDDGGDTGGETGEGDDGGDTGDDDEGCTRTQGYWKNHPDAWPEDADGQTLCGDTWMDHWQTNAGAEYGEHWNLLAHQYIAAKLNIYAGATPVADVEDALLAAKDTLEACAQVPDKDEASDLATILDGFNNGLPDTNLCDPDDDTGGDDGGGDDGGGDDGGGDDGGGDGGDPLPG